MKKGREETYYFCALLLPLPAPREYKVIMSPNTTEKYTDAENHAKA